MAYTIFFCVSTNIMLWFVVKRKRWETKLILILTYFLSLSKITWFT